jgi:uncharacterized protein YjbI with pentapeptide repeats
MILARFLTAFTITLTLPLLQHSSEWVQQTPCNNFKTPANASAVTCQEYDLTGANLESTLLNNANLQQVNFIVAQLNDAYFRGANLTEAIATENLLQKHTLILCQTILPDGMVTNRDCQSVNNSVSLDAALKDVQPIDRLTR